MVHIMPTTYLRECTDGFFTCFGNWLNVVTSGFWWTAMLLGFCITLMIVTIRYGTARAFGFGSTVGLLGALFMVNLGWMPWWIASGFILVGIIGIAVMLLSDK